MASRFLGVDRASQGSWIGRYGREGHYIRQGASGVASALPPYLGTPSFGSLGGMAWNDLADPRAIEIPGYASRSAAIWYWNTAGTLTLSPTDSDWHQVAFYCYDWSGNDQRLGSVGVDGVTHWTFANYSTYPAWLRYAYRGATTFTFTRVNSFSNVLIQGMVFDPWSPHDLDLCTP